jgi:hypothetical protein
MVLTVIEGCMFLAPGPPEAVNREPKWFLAVTVMPAKPCPFSPATLIM